MKQVLLVSGMYQAAWCWRRVTDRLTAAGCNVIVPDLAGLGAGDSGNATIDLETHIRQIVEIASACAGPVVACAHSYGGTVLTGAADRAPQCFGALILLDANFPRHGMSVLDRYAPELRHAIEARSSGNGRQRILPPPPAAALGLKSDEDRAWFDRCMRPQPFDTLTQPSQLTGRWAKVPRKIAVLATEGPRGGMAVAYAQEARHLGFDLITMDGAHQLMIEHPDAVASLLIEAAKSARAG